LLLLEVNYHGSSSLWELSLATEPGRPLSTIALG
jgi:hypothetical protein